MKSHIKSHDKQRIPYHKIFTARIFLPFQAPNWGPVGPVLQADLDHAWALGSYHRRDGTEETHGRSDPHEPGGLVVVPKGRGQGNIISA